MSVELQLEGQLRDAKALLERRDMAMRLYTNRDFKKLVIDEFCGTECARYAQESGDPLLTPEQRADALNMAQASGHFRRYMSIIIQQAATAERSVVDLESALEEVRAEPDEKEFVGAHDEGDSE